MPVRNGAPLAAVAVAVAVAAAVAVAGCGSVAVTTIPKGHLRVVAAENFWGSVAAQLGGTKVSVQSIIVNPNTDPHAYEPRASDAIAMAESQMAIVNGIGYDSWASRLLAANPSGTRVLLNVGDLLGLTQGENPHQWYSPAAVQRVVRRISNDYVRLDPADATYFERQRAAFESALSGYTTLVARIRARYAGVPVGYSESILTPLGQALGLKLLTPYSFAKAIGEGADVSAADKQIVDTQAQQHQIKVWIYNSQNVTPDVERAGALAQAAGIPVTTITETLSPATDSFEQWQVAQLVSLERALHRATGR